ncbi:MAG TPA: hypothetical protein VFN02_15850 [Ktedonobacteraceae bacterium]|nr:hypothetical protein [Ktedonobacteraceae bacterium]
MERRSPPGRGPAVGITRYDRSCPEAALRLSHQLCWSPWGRVIDATGSSGSLPPSRGRERH